MGGYGIIGLKYTEITRVYGSQKVQFNTSGGLMNQSTWELCPIWVFVWYVFFLNQHAFQSKKTRAFPASLFSGGKEHPPRRKKSLLRQHRYILIGHPMRGSAAFEFAGWGLYWWGLGQANPINTLPPTITKEQWKKPGDSLYIAGYTTQLCGEYDKPL